MVPALCLMVQSMCGKFRKECEVTLFSLWECPLAPFFFNTPMVCSELGQSKLSLGFAKLALLETHRYSHQIIIQLSEKKRNGYWGKQFRQSTLWFSARTSWQLLLLVGIRFETVRKNVQERKLPWLCELPIRDRCKPLSHPQGHHVRYLDVNKCLHSLSKFIP